MGGAFLAGVSAIKKFLYPLVLFIANKKIMYNLIHNYFAQSKKVPGRGLPKPTIRIPAVMKIMPGVFP